MTSRWVVAAILAVTAAGHLVIQTAHGRAKIATPDPAVFALPATIGDYRQTGPDLDVGDRVRELLQTSSVLMRNYASRSGWPVQLTIVHTASNRGSLHFPEVCVTGQGWEVRAQYTAPVGFMFGAKHLVLVKGDRKEAVLYWFKTGDTFTGSFIQNSCQWIWRKLTLRPAATSMIKISTPVHGPGEEAAFRQLSQFAMQLAPVVMDYL